MTALSDLFPDGSRVDASGAPTIDDHHTVRRLREMIGEPRESRAMTRPLADTDELIRLVDSAARNTTPISMDAAEATRPSKRPRRRIDALALSAGALAVAAVLAAATVGAVQMATASPAASSLESLRADEAAIQNAYESLKTTRDRIVADIEAQSAEAAQLRGTLVSTSTVVDPASDSGEGEVVALIEATDPAALAKALAAVDTYTTALAAVTVPELPAEYSRDEIDTDSLAEVGGAIDRAQEQLIALDAANAELRAAGAEVDVLRSPAEVAVTAYAATFAGTADAANARYPDAEETLHAALTASAAAIVAADLWDPAGAAVLGAYRDAFAAVAADQVRADIEQEQERQRQAEEERRQSQPDPGQGTPPDGSTDPEVPVDPTVPVEPDPEP